MEEIRKKKRKRGIREKGKKERWESKKRKDGRKQKEIKLIFNFADFH